MSEPLVQATTRTGIGSESALSALFTSVQIPLGTLRFLPDLAMKHCPTRGRLMHDGEGTVLTTDAERTSAPPAGASSPRGDFCARAPNARGPATPGRVSTDHDECGGRVVQGEQEISKNL